MGKKSISKINNTVSGVAGIASTLLENIGDNSGAMGTANSGINTIRGINSKDALSSWISDWTPQSSESMAASGLSGAARGAAAGMSAGPWGALAGGIVGAASKFFGVSNENAQREEANRRVQEAIAAQNSLLSQKEAQDALANIAAFGGYVNSHGGDFPTNFNEFNNGGSHELNPNGGVPQGYDANGTPNLVEEGETKWNDYIFSERLHVPKGFSKTFNLGKVDNTSYAKASKQIAKESKERPFDPISKNGKDKMLERLQEAQEAHKAIDKQDEEINNTLSNAGLEETLFAKGGNIHITPSKRGTFTAAAKKHGKGVQEFAKQVLANKDDYSTAMVKKANFARNAAKWHDDGGDLGFFAPAAANAGLLISDALSKPEVTHLGRMNLGEYRTRRFLPYEPLDQEYMANKYRAQAGAAARNIVNSSAGNPAAARAALVANNYNALNSLGDLYIKATETNRQRKKESLMFDMEQDRQLAALAGQEQQFNLGQELRESDINARNRAAKRNAVRAGVNTLASNISEASKYFRNLETVKNMFPLYSTTGYYTGTPKVEAMGGFLVDPDLRSFLKEFKKGGK